MIKNKNNQLYIFSLAFFFTHFFFLLYGHNIIRISGNDTLIACLLGIIIDVFLFISSIKSSYGHTMANLEVFSLDSDTKRERSLLLPLPLSLSNEVPELFTPG